MRTSDDVLAAARQYTALAASGNDPAGLYFPIMMAAARHHGLLDHPEVLTASRWAEWLHPRGIDGRFIEANSFVDVFGGDGGGEAILDQSNANRRRARVTDLFPQGMRVQYFDKNGDPIPADPKSGYPSLIPLADIKHKVSSSPNSRARLDGVSSKDEFLAGRNEEGYQEPLSQVAYDRKIEEFNHLVAETMQPDRSGALVHGGGEPLTDEEYFEHLAFVTDVTNAGLGATYQDQGMKLGSEAAFKDEYGRWSQETLGRMLEMSTAMFEELTVNKPKGQKAIVLGGLPGSGKSTLLSQMDAEGKIDLNDWISINPDDVKERMIEAGWYPQIDGLTPGDTAGFIHAQSAEMSAMLERMLMKEGYNLVFDVTLGDNPNSEGKTWMDYTLGYLKAYGYDSPDGIFINSTKDHSLQSVFSRHQNGLNTYRTGLGRSESDKAIGGRFVPAKVIQGDAAQSEAINAGNFARLKSQFTNWATYDVGNAPGTKPDPQLSDSTPDMPGNFPAGYFSGTVASV